MLVSGSRAGVDGPQSGQDQRLAERHLFPRRAYNSPGERIGHQLRGINGNNLRRRDTSARGLSAAAAGHGRADFRDGRVGVRRLPASSHPEDLGGQQVRFTSLLQDRRVRGSGEAVRRLHLVLGRRRGLRLDDPRAGSRDLVQAVSALSRPWRRQQRRRCCSRGGRLLETHHPRPVEKLSPRRMVQIRVQGGPQRRSQG